MGIKLTNTSVIYGIVEHRDPNTDCISDMSSPAGLPAGILSTKWDMISEWSSSSAYST